MCVFLAGNLAFPASPSLRNPLVGRKDFGKLHVKQIGNLFYKGGVNMKNLTTIQLAEILKKLSDENLEKIKELSENILV